MKKYSSYKNSGIEWLNDIPSTWSVHRIKDLTNTTSGTTPLSKNKEYYENGIYNWIRTTDLNNSELYQSEYKVTELAFKECNLKVIPLDTVLVAMYGGFGTIGKNAILKTKSTINQSVCAILPKQRNFNSTYLLYFLKYFRKDWKLFADGTRKDPNINQDAVKNLFIVVPPIQDQHFIANFLNQKINAIDNEIILLRDKIERYNELKKRIIKISVCKGLNSNVELKSCDVKWIGSVPSHWHTRRGKDVFTEISKSGLPASEGEEVGEYKFYTSSIEQSKFINQFTNSGEALIFSTGGTAAVHYAKGKYAVSTDCWLLKSNKCDMRYYGYFFNSILFEIKQLAFKGSSLEHLQRDFIKSGVLPFPPIEEQNKIADYLDRKTNIVEEIISNIKSRIEILNELKTTFITDVVMGKVKVTG